MLPRNQLLLALTAMNLCNYVDRYILSALLPQIQRDLQLSDSQGGMLGTAFMLVYFLISPLFGWLGDRGARRLWLALGVVCWSLATWATGQAQSFVALCLCRAAVGVGEAAYASIAPAMLADATPAARRGRIMAYFYIATPVGSAMGYMLGGYLGQRWGWRPAFQWVAYPGLVLAWLAYRLPVVPTVEPDLAESAAEPAVPVGIGATYAALWQNRTYVRAVAGYTAYIFALGGLAFWMPTYMIRERGWPAKTGLIAFGAITVITGLMGTLTGGFLSERLLRITDKAYTWICAVAMLGAAAGTAAALVVVSPALFLLSLVVAQFCIFLCTGPINALLVGSVPVAMRATGMAMSTFCIHLFGDAISPTLIGEVSDRTHLGAGMQTIPIFFVLAGVLWSRTLISGRRPQSRSL